MNSPSPVSAAALAESCQRPDPPLLLDVRTPVEVREISIAGVTKIPLDALKPDAFAREHGAGPRVVVICRGGTRAKKAAGMLASAGMSNVAVLDGGMQAW